MFTEYARSGKAEWLYDSLVGENGAKIWHDEFKMNTTDGQLKLRNVSVGFGTNYATYMDDRLIGILSENLNLRIRNIIFDNFTILYTFFNLF